jgi:hypothetical protein
MKRLLTALLVTVLTLVGSASMAGASNQPGQGEHSTQRNAAGFGGGPHCHVLVVNDGHGPFTIQAFPSHTGHMHAGNDVFNADPDCDGTAG